MFVIDKIKKFYLSGDKYSDFAILYRANQISSTFEKLLKKYKIPYKIYGGIPLFSRKEVKDILAYLRVISFPEDDFSFLRIVNEPKRAIGSALLKKLRSHAEKEQCSLFNSIPTFKGSGKGFKSLMDFYNLIISIKNRINDFPLLNLIDVILEESGYEDMLSSNDLDYARLESIYELKDVLDEAKYINGDNFDKLSSILNDLSLFTDESIADKDSVLLSTYHQVKGLEFKTVFMVAMEEGIFPSDFHNDDLDLEEERRICYVGITRAKERLYITNAKTRLLYGQEENNHLSRFVKEMGQDHLKNSSKDSYKKAKEKFESYMAKKIKNDNINPENDAKYHVRDRIEHKDYGLGMVVSVGKDDYIMVAFPAPIGIKSLVKDHPSYKKLEKK
ncbi:ATP-binding domain-containing protein, partial [bacterium]|nr:ATP-binding domain-containing protein [bacterium]